MKTLDLKKEFKHLYKPSARGPEIIQVPRLQFIMIDGAIEKGSEPGKSPKFADATQTVYSLAYTLKFMLKKRPMDPVDYPVMPLEGLWWVEDGTFDIAIKDNWFFTLMIMQPEVITADIFAEAREQVRRKKGESELLSKARLEHFEEGLCVQAMHIGPYDTEPGTVERMRAFAEEKGYRDILVRDRQHHEIYLGDPRKGDPAKLKTVLRHPVEKIKVDP